MRYYKVQFELKDRNGPSKKFHQGAICVWANSPTGAQEIVVLMFRELECNAELGKEATNAPFAVK